MKDYDCYYYLPIVTALAQVATNTHTQAQIPRPIEQVRVRAGIHSCQESRLGPGHGRASSPAAHTHTMHAISPGTPPWQLWAGSISTRELPREGGQRPGCRCWWKPGPRAAAGRVGEGTGLVCSPQSVSEAPGTKELFGEPEGRGVAANWPHVLSSSQQPRPHAPFTPALPGATGPLFVLLCLLGPLPELSLL